PCAPGPACYTREVAAWTASGQFSTFKPSTGAGGVYPGGIPEGLNIGSLGNENGNGTMTQTLGVTLQPNTSYTLGFSVGSRADFVFAGYSVELLAGSTTLATESSLVPPAGTFATGRLVFLSTNANPSLLGQALGIRLTSGGRGNAGFDKI